MLAHCQLVSAGARDEKSRGPHRTTRVFLNSIRRVLGDQCQKRGATTAYPQQCYCGPARKVQLEVLRDAGRCICPISRCLSLLGLASEDICEQEMHKGTYSTRQAVRVLTLIDHAQAINGQT